MTERQRQKASDSNEEKEYRKTNGTEQTERKKEKKKEKKQEAAQAISAYLAADGGCCYSAGLRRALAVLLWLTLYAKRKKRARVSLFLQPTRRADKHLNQ